MIKKDEYEMLNRMPILCGVVLFSIFLTIMAFISGEAGILLIYYVGLVFGIIFGYKAGISLVVKDIEDRIFGGIK